MTITRTIPTYSKTDVDGLLAGKASSSHTHAISDVTDLSTALSGKASSSHTHAQSDITSLTTDLAGKANLSGGNTFTGDQIIQGNVTVLSPLGYGMMRVGTFGDASKQYFVNAEPAATLIFGQDSFFATSTRLSRIDFYATSMYFQGGGNAYFDANMQLARKGVATGTANQFGSYRFIFQGSRWTGSASQIVSQAAIETITSTTVNGGLYLQTIVRNPDNTADITASRIYNEDGGRCEIYLPLHCAQGVILTAPNSSKWRLKVDNSGNLSTEAV